MKTFGTSSAQAGTVQSNPMETIRPQDMEIPLSLEDFNVSRLTRCPVNSKRVADTP
jgi:hypothetical protein